MRFWRDGYFRFGLPLAIPASIILDALYAAITGSERAPVVRLLLHASLIYAPFLAGLRWLVQRNSPRKSE